MSFYSCYAAFANSSNRAKENMVIPSTKTIKDWPQQQELPKGTMTDHHAVTAQVPSFLEVPKARHMTLISTATTRTALIPSIPCASVSVSKLNTLCPCLAILHISLYLTQWNLPIHWEGG